MIIINSVSILNETCVSFNSMYKHLLLIFKSNFKLKVHKQQPPKMSPQLPMGMPPLASLQQIPMMQNQINMIKEQIQQSEKNLSAQRDMFKVKTKTKIEEAILLKQTEKYNALLNESQLDISTFEDIIKKIIESCTKEAIGNGRNFVFNKNINEKQIEMICYYLQQKIMSKESNDDARLHMIYFMNDMIHHGYFTFCIKL